MRLNLKNLNFDNFFDKTNKALEKYYKYLIIFLLLISLLRPLLANLKYPLLTSWDTWNFLSFAKQIYDNGGLIPHWDTISLYPDGRPFLYPPLVSIILANLSLWSGVSIFFLIKISTVFLYPLYAIMAYLLTLPFKNKKLSLLTLVFLISVNQAYVNSLNSLSQFVEIFLLFAAVVLIYAKKYNWAILPFGLMFWTHAFTPFFFALGLFVYAIYQKEERKKILKILIWGSLLGLLWLYKFFIYRDWIHSNLNMLEHFLSFKFIYRRIFIENWSFAVILSMTAIMAAFDKQIIKKIKENRFFFLLAIISLSTLPIYYYPERGITYTLPFFLPLSAFIFLNSSFKKLRKAYLAIFLLLFLVGVYSLNPVGWLRNYHFSFNLIILILMLIIAWAYVKVEKKSILYFILIPILFLHMEVSGVMLPFLSWWDGGIARMNAPVEIYDACKWLKIYDPNAIFTADSVHIIGACQYQGLKGSEAVVVEFSKDGKLNHYQNANYLISASGGYVNGYGNNYDDLWYKGPVAIYRLRH